MSYSSVVAAALSGASLRRLSYWRSPRSTEGPLLAPTHHSPRTRAVYSYQDVVALRAFVYLRTQGVSLQRVRKAIANLRDLGETSHLSSYRLVAVGKDVAWIASDESAVDLTGRPGQQVIAEMVDILSEFHAPRDRKVVPLHHPKPGLDVDPEVRGGFPVITGTRVPYDVVAALLDDGVSEEDVASFYPTVPPDAARGAREFARYVDTYRERVPV
jgi:uncharacterized protein (DUF433 family)